MKCNQYRPGFELVSPCSFPTAITTTPRAPPQQMQLTKTQEDFFIKYFTSHFICKFRKGCSKFACERELETEHNWNILTPKLWPSALCLSRSPWLLNRSPGFPYYISSYSRQLYCLSSTLLACLLARRTQLSSVQFVGLILPSNSHAVIWTRLRNFFRYLATGMCHFR